ncbi:MAG TPA: CPBP family intramembrane glutamic endopeptidase [Thermoanaerobaculia bacterium]|nr:CPBP family intramembrane glutamic endopeptidase [Thermoanaerobaculia bacterium]
MEFLPSPSTPPRPRWHPLARVGLYLLAYLVVQVAVGVLFGSMAYRMDGRAFHPGGFGRSTEFLLLAVVFEAPPVLLVTWLFVHYLDRRNLASLGARWPEGSRRMALRQLATMPLAVGGLIGSWLLLIFLLPPSLGTLRFDGLNAAFTRGTGPSWWPLPPVLLLAALLLVFVLQGGVEEWIMRGYIYRALKERWRPFWAALASSALFSLLHADNPDVSAVALLNIILAGLILAALVERGGSLWGATLAHGFWNFAIACVVSVPVSGIRTFHLLDLSVTGNETLTGGAFGPEGSLVLTLLGLALAVALWLRLPAARPRKEIAPSAAEDTPESVPL